MKPVYKILVVVGIIIVIGAGAYFIWWLFIDEPTVDVPPGGGGTLPPGDGTAPISTSTVPEGAGVSLPRAISDHSAFDYWLVPETGEIYYLTAEGQVYAIKDGPDLEISRQAIAALNRAEPSLDGRRVLVSFGNPSAPQWAIFDTVDSVWRPLPREVVNAGWGRTSSELIAVVTSGGDANLSFVDISRTPPAYTMLVRDFRMEGVLLSTLGNGNVLIVEQPSIHFEGKAWRLDPGTRALTLILSPSAGRMVKLEKAANLSYLGTANTFEVADGALQNASSFFFRTLPDKCAMSASTTYCFVPRNLASSVTFPDDYLMRAFYSIDSLYAIAHPSLALRPLVIGEGAYDASRVRANEKAVYFLDRYTNLLYELER